MQRSLSGFEKAFCLSEPLVPINFSLVACFTNAPAEATLRLALDRLHERYPMAALHLVHDEQGEPCFTDVGVPTFPLRVTEQTHAGHWQQVAAEELGKNFDLAEGPLLRAVLVKRSADPGADLVLTFHHGIADGMSAVYFLRDLLCLLNDLQSDLPVAPPPPDVFSLIPEIAKRSLSLKAQILGMKSGLYLMQHFPPLKKRLPPADRLIAGRFSWQHFGLTSRGLTPAQTSRLADLCREKETSVHAAICTAWLRARLEIIPDTKYWKRTVSIPVNLRKALSAENAFGLVMSNAVVAADCHPSLDFWTVAREIKTCLDLDISTGRVYRWLLTTSGLMDSSSDGLRRAMPMFVTQPVPYDFSITNLGRLSLPAQGDSWKLEAVYGPLVNTSERELTVGVSTACERLTMTLTYRDFVLDPKKAEKMADTAVEILEKAIGW